MAQPAGGFALAPRLVVDGIALDHRVEGRGPGVLRQLGISGAQQRHGAPGLDQAVQPLQGPRAIHPMEGTAHDREMEPAQLGPDIGRAALDEADLEPRRGGILGGDPQHLGLRIDGHDLAGMGRQGQRQLPGAAAQIQDPAIRAKARELDQPVDQARGIGRPALQVMQGGGAEPAFFEGDDGRVGAGRGLGGHGTPGWFGWGPAGSKHGAAAPAS